MTGSKPAAASTRIWPRSKYVIVLVLVLSKFSSSRSGSYGTGLSNSYSYDLVVATLRKGLALVATRTIRA
eukprot:scaffold255809_cov17-Prasinocladus_malaysianus.AAC.1